MAVPFGRIVASTGVCRTRRGSAIRNPPNDAGGGAARVKACAANSSTSRADRLGMPFGTSLQSSGGSLSTIRRAVA